MNDVQNAKSETPKRNQISHLEAGAHQCWYPLALSSDVPRGKAIGSDFADGRIVIYRGEDDVVRVMSAYCRHMGADLSFGGEVVGNNIRCPYHHWAYGDGGKCAEVASGDPIPKGSSLVHLPTEEQLGLIWAFLGESPLYNAPTFEEFDPEKHVYRAFEVKMQSKLQVEPWVFATNVFDVVHNRVVHGLQIADPAIEEVDAYLRRMTWDAAHTGEKQSGDWRPDIEVMAVNGIRTKSKIDGRLKWYISALTPCGRQGTRSFFTIITTRDDKAEQYLDSWQAMHNRFVNEDLPILNNMRGRELHLVAADKAMGRFIQAARAYPRTTLDALETSANVAGRK